MAQKSQFKSRYTGLSLLGDCWAVLSSAGAVIAVFNYFADARAYCVFRNDNCHVQAVKSNG